MLKLFWSRLQLNDNFMGSAYVLNGNFFFIHRNSRLKEGNTNILILITIHIYFLSRIINIMNRCYNQMDSQLGNLVKKQNNIFSAKYWGVH